MCPVEYYTVYRDLKTPFNCRLRVVQYALKTDLSQAARGFGTTRKTARKWVRRYGAEGVSGLKDRPRAPQRIIPHKTPEHLAQEVVRPRRRFSSWGRERLRKQFGLPLSGPSIDRILKEEGLIKPRRRCYKRKRDLRGVKARLSPFEKLSLDVKELRDIPNYYPAIIRHGLPRYQYSARDIRTGAVFICYSHESNSTNATYFLAYLAHQLREYGVQVEEANQEVVTDNGSEFAGGAKAIRPVAYRGFRILETRECSPNPSVVSWFCFTKPNHPGGEHPWPPRITH